MKLIGKTLMFGLMAAATAVACSSGHQAAPGSTEATGPQGPASSDGVGEIGGALTLPGGEHLSRLDYKLTNGTNTYAGHYDITNTVTPSFVITSVAAGTGYQLTLTAHTDDTSATAATCQYPAAGQPNTTNITVVNRTTTIANINMQCTVDQGLDAGSLLVNGMTNNCPVWNSIVANPVNITLDAGGNVNDSGTAGSSAFFPNSGVPVKAVIQDGQSLVLVGGATAPNPGALTFTWTASGGTISSASGTADPNSTDAGATNQTIFTCPPTGATTDETITLTLNDGADAAACNTMFTTATVTVTCSNPGICGGAPFATSAGGACSNQALPPVNGYPYVTNGTTDPGNPADFCCSPAPTCAAGTVESSPFQNNTPAFPGTGGCSGSTPNNVNGCCVGLLPCTTVGQTGCVKCAGNNKTTGTLANGTCTATQAQFVGYDIKSGKATAAGNNPAGSCYACLFANTCLNDTQFSDTGKDCDDPALTSGTAAQCESVISCVLGSSTATTPTCAQGAAVNCYCGTAPEGTTCQGNPAPAVNGVCDAVIAAGAGFMTQDGTDVTAHFTDGNTAAGIADQIFGCAVNSGCTACLGAF